MKAYSESTTPIASKDEQGTPQWLVKRVASVLGITFHVDVCASAANHKCPIYWTKEDNCFSFEWGQEALWRNFWMNPPYSQPNLPDFTDYAGIMARQCEIVVVGCVPHAPDADWFQKYVWNVVPTLLIPDGRINFELDGVERPGNPLATCFPIWTPWRAPTSIKYFARNKPRTPAEPARRIRVRRS